MASSNYLRVKVSFAEDSFSIFCTQETMDKQRDDVEKWVAQLANRLRWRDYTIAISEASAADALEREHALFENRFPAD